MSNEATIVIIAMLAGVATGVLVVATMRIRDKMVRKVEEVSSRISVFENTNNWPKVCKDCKHSKSGWAGYPLKCYAPENMVPNLVDGGAVQKYIFCETHRDSDSKTCCGKSGRWFEPKEGK